MGQRLPTLPAMLVAVLLALGAAETPGAPRATRKGAKS